MAWLLLVAGVGALFFVLVPGVGAFLARSRWRAFRGGLLALARWPSVGRGTAPMPPGFAGFHRFFGTLEALQGDDRVWLSDGTVSVAAELRGVRVYLLPGADGGRATDEQIASISWDRIFSLPAGTPVLVGGPLFIEDGRAVFRSREATHPLAVIYDCPREEILRRATRGGRHQNEYWNELTVPSLVTGSFILLALSWVLLGRPEGRVAAIASFATAFGPLAPYLPPAFPLYFAYRWAWRRARELRAQRDLARLPLRWFPPPTEGDRRLTLLPDLEPYALLRGRLIDGGARLALDDQTVDIGEASRPEAELPRRCARELAGGPSWVYGALDGDGEPLALRRPADPMAEFAVLPGDPQLIARCCDGAARRYELASAAFIGTAIASNLLLVLLIAARLLG